MDSTDSKTLIETDLETRLNSNPLQSSQHTQEIDEIDQALKELGLAQSTSDPSNQWLGGSGSQIEIISRICSVDCKMLDSDQELRRMFGSRVVS